MNQKTLLIGAIIIGIFLFFGFGGNTASILGSHSITLFASGVNQVGDSADYKIIEVTMIDKNKNGGQCTEFGGLQVSHSQVSILSSGQIYTIDGGPNQNMNTYDLSGLSKSIPSEFVSANFNNFQVAGYGWCGGPYRQQLEIENQNAECEVVSDIRLKCFVDFNFKSYDGNSGVTNDFSGSFKVKMFKEGYVAPQETSTDTGETSTSTETDALGNPLPSSSNELSFLEKLNKWFQDLWDSIFK